MMSYKERPVMYVFGSVLLLALIVFVGVKTWNASVEHKYIGKPDTVRDTIVIQGEGKVTAEPTLALIDFGVVTEAPTPGQAQTQNTQKMNAVIQAMKDLGIPSADVASSNYQLSAMYDYSRQPPVIRGYTVAQMVAIKVRDFDKIGNVMERAVSLGVNQVNNLRFTIDDPTALRDEARLKALTDAKNKADTLAKALGVEIVRVVSFSESGGGFQPPTPMYYDRELSVSQAAPMVPNVEPGTQDVQMNVAVTYEIR